MKPTTLRGLRVKAGRSTHARGHHMRWEDVGLFRSRGTCQRCGMRADVMLHPAANDVAIGGEAVALNCDPDYRIKQELSSVRNELRLAQEELAKHRNPNPYVVARRLAQDLGNFVNSYGHDQVVPEFLNSLNHEHRTLQQSITGLFMRWFAHLASLTESQYDLRNEHAVKVAKKIRTCLEADYGSAWFHMPHF